MIIKLTKIKDEIDKEIRKTNRDAYVRYSKDEIEILNNNGTELNSIQQATIKTTVKELLKSQMVIR